MALLVTIDITAGSRLQRIEQFEVRRLEDLIDRDHPDDEHHRYRVTPVCRYDSGIRTIRADMGVEFMHRYGDGARRCVERALEALRLARFDTLSE